MTLETVFALVFAGGVLVAAVALAGVVPTAQVTDQSPGLVVEHVAADSAAGKAGLAVGDRLLTYDGKALPSPLALQALQDNTVRRGEIVVQVLFFARELRADPWTAAGLPGSAPIDHITNIVLMGMGEPLHNYDNVLQALRILNSADGFNLGARHMTVSTVGLVPAIRKLSQEPLQVNLAISLHAPTDELRSRTMPVNRKYPLQDLLAACQDYIAATKRQVTFEYVLLSGVNDKAEYAHQLGELMAPLKQYAHVNCIPVNATSASYKAPGPGAIRAFRDILFEHGVSNSVRAERGDDIAAACGQLRTRFEKKRQ